MKLEIIIANQMILAEKVTGKQSVFDPNTGEIFSTTGQGLIPLLSDNEYYPLTHLNEKNMLSVSELLKPENNGILREINGLPTDVSQTKAQKSNGQSTEKQQTNNGNLTAILRKLDRSLTEKRVNETIEKYNLKLFSQNFTGDILELSKQIESYAIVILSNTNKKPTINKTRLDFRKAKELAAKNKDIELEKILEKLQLRRTGQLGIVKMHGTVNKKANKERAKTIVFISIIFIAAIFAIIKQIATSYSTDTPTVKKTFLTEEIIKSKISDYSIEHNIKVYSWRTNKIISELKGTELSETKINDTLNYLIRTKWTNK